MINMYFDTETTGLNPTVNDIVQLSCVLEGPGIYREFNEFCKPFSMKDISPDALKTNGQTMEKIATYQTPQELFAKLKVFLSGINFKDGNKITLVGQNTVFDCAMLKKFFFKNGFNSEAFDRVFNLKFVDLLSITHLLKMNGLIDPENLKLTTIAAYFGIEMENAHDAFCDVKTTYALMKEIGRIYLRTPQEVDINIVKKDTPIYVFFTKLSEQQSN